MDLSSATIAVVDDDEDTVNLFTDVIQMNGYIVIGFENPQFLIDYISEHQDQLKFVIIDYRMPQMSGCKLANQIRKLNPNIEMVFITAYNDIVDNALNLEVLRKPLHINEILYIVNKYIHH